MTKILYKYWYILPIILGLIVLLLMILLTIPKNHCHI